MRRPGIVHRLDKDTSGVMVVAKNDASHRALARLFAAHDLTRIYRALVWGGPKAQKGTIDAAIGRHPVDRKRMAVRRSSGRAALTEYWVERRFGPPLAPVASLLGAGSIPAGPIRSGSIWPTWAARWSAIPVYGRKSRNATQPGIVENLRTAGPARGGS